MSPSPPPVQPGARLMTALVLLAGCVREPMSLEQARTGTVIDAAGARLSGKTLEGWLLSAAHPPSDSIAAPLVSGWIDGALLATALRDGLPLDDSATVDAAILPDATRGAILQFWHERQADQPPATDAQVDSLIDLDRVRVLQLLQLPVPQGSDSAATRRIAVRAAELRRQASLPGGDFSAMVRAASEDSIGRANDGFLPATTREQLPAPIAAAVWSLQPGGVSPVLRSVAAFYVFRRATRSESREGLRTWLKPELARIAQRKSTDSVLRARRVRLAQDALQRVRAMAREPVTAEAGAALASWTGGELAPITVRRWVMMLTPGERAALSDASDSTATNFVNNLVQWEVFFALAVPEGGVTARARRALTPAYRTALDSVKAVLLRNAGESGTEPAVAATALVDSMVRLAPYFRPLPGGLAGVLRARYSVAVDTSALGVLLRASRTAWQARHPADSAAESPAVP